MTRVPFRSSALPAPRRGRSFVLRFAPAGVLGCALLLARAGDEDFAARKSWWSFQPVRDPAIPTPKNSKWSAHPVDRFLLAKMEQRGLTPAPDADPRVFIRRLTFALTGLPPTPSEVEAFVTASSIGHRPSAIGHLTDRLLARPAFGERWARHWMDLVRYADSHGSEGDPEIPFAWRYRDYLIRAFNADVPADQLIREHLAGDLLPASQIRWNKSDGLNESALGPAHWRLVEHGFQPVDTLDDQVRVIENQIDVLGKAFQGLTIACARCHDHKFDPITQRDYTAVYGVLASSRPAQVQVDAPELLNKNRAELLALKSRIKAVLADSWKESIPQLIVQLTRGSSADPQRAALHKRIASIEREVDNLRHQALANRLVAQPATLEVPPELAPPLKHPPIVVPLPISRWSFDSDTRDQRGSLDGELVGNATLRNGRLVLDGKGSFLRTAPLPRDLREKTLEAWVAPATLDQRGGGVISIETTQPHHFDSIVFAEKDPRQWLAGSEFFKRTQSVAGAPETAKPGELVHIAIAYRADGTITLFRNGAPYGQSYKPAAALHVFPAGSARVLLGLRHTGAGNGFFAGEIDEARLYDRALTADDVAASFKAGPAGITSAQLAAAMTPEQRARHATLTADLVKLREELGTKALTPDDSLAAALKDAQSNVSNPLHAWAKLAKLDGAALSSGWTELVKVRHQQLNSTREHDAQFTTAWDFAKGDDAQWFRNGSAFDPGSAGVLAGRTREATKASGVTPDAVGQGLALSGDFSIEPEGDRVLKGLLPAGISSHLLSEKHGGLFTSPRFKITTDFISVRAAGGKGAMVRVIVDNYPLGSNPIFPKAELARDDPGWVRMDTAYRKGAMAYIEFGTADDLTRKLGKNSDPQGRSWFSAERVVFHDKELPRDEPPAPALLLFATHDLKSPAALAALYERTLQSAVDAWSGNTLTNEQAAFLDFFVRRALLPTSLKSLPKVAPLVAEYRRLEHELPAPRRAPGVIEGTTFDAPLFTRGEHSKPADPVPRAFIEVLGAKPFFPRPPDARPHPHSSGRLELANAIASPSNPLTARVMVNRTWHHLFGRGLVPTVDNVGRLGEKPTHPELLDYLASRFVAEGWSFKKLIRELVTSRVYQLASEPTPAARERDSDNELLSHFRVQRIEAESIRDALLAVSGRLDSAPFGPPVATGDRARRSIYLAVRRNNPSPFLETFDAPRPFTTLGRRDATNVPAQSLTLLNDPFVIDLAGAWAASLIRDGATADADACIRRMFVRAFARTPTADEAAKSRRYLAELSREHGAAENLAASENVWRDFAQSLFNLKEFIYVR